MLDQGPWLVGKPWARARGWTPETCGCYFVPLHSRLWAHGPFDGASDAWLMCWLCELWRPGLEHRNGRRPHNLHGLLIQHTPRCWLIDVLVNNNQRFISGGWTSHPHSQPSPPVTLTTTDFCRSDRRRTAGTYTTKYSLKRGYVSMN